MWLSFEWQGLTQLDLVRSASQQIQCPDIADIDMDNVEHTFKANIIQYIGLVSSCPPPPPLRDLLNSPSPSRVSPPADQGCHPSP